MAELTEQERVALDEHGAEVYRIASGLLEVACHSHATQLIAPERERAYLERRAKGHNQNWHPHLAEKTDA